MLIRMMILALVAAVAAQAAPAAAQTRYFDAPPGAEELQRALTPQAQPQPAPGAAEQPPLDRSSSENGALARRGARPGTTMTIPVVPAERPKVGLMVNFAFNSAELTPDARHVLDTLATAIDRLPQFRFQIEGHTDAVGGDAFNLTLSQRRAAAVVQYLVLNHNISPARLAAIGFGKRKLRDPDHPTDAINRRVEIMNAGPA